MRAKKCRGCVTVIVIYSQLFTSLNKRSYMCYLHVWSPFEVTISKSSVTKSPYSFSTRGNQNASTCQKLKLAAILRILSFGSPFPLAAFTTFVLLLDLYDG